MPLYAISLTSAGVWMPLFSDDQFVGRDTVFQFQRGLQRRRKVRRLRLLMPIMLPSSFNALQFFGIMYFDHHIHRQTGRGVVQFF